MGYRWKRRSLIQINISHASTPAILFTLQGAKKLFLTFRKKVQMLRKHLEGLSSQELDLFIERLEESYNRKKVGDENAEK